MVLGTAVSILLILYTLTCSCRKAPFPSGCVPRPRSILFMPSSCVSCTRAPCTSRTSILLPISASRLMSNTATSGPHPFGRYGGDTRQHPPLLALVSGPRSPSFPLSSGQPPRSAPLTASHGTPREDAPAPPRRQPPARRQARKATPSPTCTTHAGVGSNDDRRVADPPLPRAAFGPEPPPPPLRSVRERRHDVVPLKSSPISSRTGPARSRVRSHPPHRALSAMTTWPCSGPGGVWLGGAWGRTVLAVGGVGGHGLRCSGAGVG